MIFSSTYELFIASKYCSVQLAFTLLTSKAETIAQIAKKNKREALVSVVPLRLLCTFLRFPRQHKILDFLSKIVECYFLSGPRELFWVRKPPNIRFLTEINNCVYI